MGRAEREFMKAGSTEVSEQAIIDAAWLAEPTVCLLWALGYVSDLPPYDHQVDPELTNKLPKESTQVLVTKAKLRPTESIQRQRDLAELWHWRSRTRKLAESGRLPSVLPVGMSIDTVIRMASVKAAEDGVVPAPIGMIFQHSVRPIVNLVQTNFRSPPRLLGNGTVLSIGFAGERPETAGKIRRPTHSTSRPVLVEKSRLQCAGINRHEAENGKFLRVRSSDPLGPEFCVGYREVHGEA